MSVTVLTPNGRRQSVKITPNTTLLQVLEEVCSKHGFNPEDYDIRHHSKILDLSAIFRFSGLPNNAQLEMIEAVRQRSESPVILGLHLESGDRLTGKFIPSDNLWHVISTLVPEQAKSFSSPVIIYMRQEVCGKENLKKTTLRSLGLIGGRAILRFFNRTPEELRKQANVSTVLSRSPYHDREKKEICKNAEIKSKEKSKTQVDEKKGAPREQPESPNKTEYKAINKEKNLDRSSEMRKTEVHEANCPATENQNVTKGKINEKVIQQNKDKSSERKPKENEVVAVEEKKEAILLGERNAVAFNLNKVKPTVTEEMPDDFYDLTVADAKLLLREAKQLCVELENAPLMTSAQRELEKNTKILSLLNQYKKTVLRIKFPDRTVLQGTFSSVETVSAVEKFVSNYLENPNLSFYLYTTPPKEILKSDSNLLESNCVPCAVLYFGVPPDVKEPKNFLKQDVLKNFSTPSAAALTALQSRGLTIAKDDKERGGNRDGTGSSAEGGAGKALENESSSSVAGPSISHQAPHTMQARDQENSPPFKVPKWFKIQK